MTRRLVVTICLVTWTSLGIVVADEIVDARIGVGVRAEIVWAGRTGPAYAIPVRGGQRLPYGPQKLVIHVLAAVIEDAGGSEFCVREHPGNLRYCGAGSARPDGSLHFEVPLDLAGNPEERTVAVTVGPGAAGARRAIELLRVRLRPDSERVRVVSVDRYPQLAWDGCQAPCYRFPRSLYDITPEEWRQTFRVVEIEGRKRHIVEEFDVRMSDERPASIVFVVDTSGSVLQESSGDPSRKILEYFATFPDEAYGGDRVRHSDRLAMLFFDDDVVGYYGGRNGDGETISPVRRFWSPGTMTDSWDRLCLAIERGTPATRFDDAWLIGSRDALERAGYPLPEERRILDAMCGEGAPTEVLSAYREAVRTCRTDDACSIRSAGTHVLPALRRAATDLNALHENDGLPRGTVDNHRVVVLISDGIDASLMNADADRSRSHYLAMLDALEGKRFYFVDVHSELVLSKLVTHALARSAPLYRAALAGVEDEIDDPELSLRIARALFASDDASFRRDVWDAIRSRGVDRLAPDAPALRRVIADVLGENIPLPDAIRAAVRQTYPAVADMILGGRQDPKAGGWEDAIPENWLRTLCNMSTYFSPGMMRNTVSPEMLRRETDALRARTVDRFHQLAVDRNGLSVTLDDCTLDTADGERLTGAVCAFRTILDSLRDTLHLRYVPGDRDARKVEIDLTPYGKEMLEERQLRRARLFKPD